MPRTWLSVAVALFWLVTIGRESAGQIHVLRVEGKVGEGMQTGQGGSISTGLWQNGRPFGRFKTWPRAQADFRLAAAIHARAEELTYIYLGKLAASLTIHKAEWTMGVHYGTALLSVDKLDTGELFRLHTSVAKLVGGDFDAVIRADRVEPTMIVMLRGEATMHHRHLLDTAPVVLHSGESVSVELDRPVSVPKKLSAGELAPLMAKMREFRESRRQ